MKIILANGIELCPILVMGGPAHVQGYKRDVLSFIFPATENMFILDELFTPEACESIIIISDDGSESINKAYTIRVKLEKTTVEVASATVDSDAVTEERITVSMAQRTYTESQLASLTDTIDVLVMESLMSDVDDMITDTESEETIEENVADPSTESDGNAEDPTDSVETENSVEEDVVEPPVEADGVTEVATNSEGDPVETENSVEEDVVEPPVEADGVAEVATNSEGDPVETENSVEEDATEPVDSTTETNENEEEEINV